MGLRSQWDTGRLPDTIGLLARLVLGAVLIWAGGAKVTSPALSAQAVRAYKILPYDAAGFVGPDGNLDTIPGAQFGHHAGDVRLHRAQRDEQLFGDLAVRPPACDRDENLLLPVGECLDRLRWRRSRPGVGEGPEQPGGDAGGDERIAVGGGVDGFGQQDGTGVLQQEASRAGTQGRVHVVVEVEGGDDYDGERLIHRRTGDGSGGFDAVKTGHPDVEQADIGP